MEFWKQDNVMKTEQSTAMGFYIHKAQTFVKLLEIASAIIILFWSTTRLPIALNIFIDFAKQTCALLLTTPSVFLIGNAIVVTLFAQFPSPKSDQISEFVTECRLRSPIATQQLEIAEPVIKVETLLSTSISEAEVIRCCTRTQSEKVLNVVSCDNVKKELRRTKTSMNYGMTTNAKTTSFEPADELSEDEFRRRVEAFISKQQRLIREENMALVVSS